MKPLHFVALIALAGVSVPVPSAALLIPAVQKLREPANRLRSGVTYVVDLDTPFDIGPGDELDLTLRFGDGGTLRLANPGTLRLSVGAVDPGTVALEADGTLGFIDATGSLVDPTALRMRIGGPGELGGVFDAAEFVDGPDPVGFSGLRLRQGVIAEVGAGRPATVGRLYFSFTGTNLDLVPEPSSWALMLTGFGLAGAALRRQTTSMKLSSTRF